MHIVIVGGFPFPSGDAAASRMRNFALGLRDNGAHVHVVPLAPAMGVPLEQTAVLGGIASYQGVTYQRLGNSWTWQRNLAQDQPARLRLRNRRLIDKVEWFLRLYGTTPAAYRTVAQRISNGTCDLLICYGRNAAILAPLAALCKQKGVPCILDIVELGSYFSGLGGKLSPVYWDGVAGVRLLPRLFDGITVITSALQRMYEGMGCTNILIVPSIEELDGGSPPNPTLRSGPFELVYVGALSPRDAPDVLLDAMRILAMGDLPVALKIIGKYEDTTEGQQLAQRCRNDPLLQTRVHLLGSVSDTHLVQHMHNCDGLVLTRRNAPTEVNSFPTRLVEYLKQGRPVFVSDVGDVSRYLRDGVDALLIHPDDSAQVAETFAKVARRPDRGTAIGLQGWKRGVECFDRREHAARVIDFAQQLRHSNHMNARTMP